MVNTLSFPRVTHILLSSGNSDPLASGNLREKNVHYLRVQGLLITEVPIHLEMSTVIQKCLTASRKMVRITVVAARFAHPILDSPTLPGCLSKMADPADGWVRMGGPI